MKKLLLLSGIILLIASACTTTTPKETTLGSYLYEHKAMPMVTANSQLSASWNYSITYIIKNNKL